MKRTHVLLLGCGLLWSATPPAAAQTGKSGAAKGASKAGAAKAGTTSARSLSSLLGRKKQDKEPSTPAERDYQNLLDQVDAAKIAHFKKLREDLQKARAAGRAPRSLSISMTAVPAEILAGFLAAADKYASTDDAIRFLVYVLGAEKDPDSLRKVAKRLLRDHMQSEALKSVPAQLPKLVQPLGREAVDDLFTRIIGKSPHGSVQASAYFARAEMDLRGRPDAAAKKRTLADLRRALKLDPKGAFAKRAEGMLFEAENLAIGSIAPNIVGKDTDGVEFSLYDYKGKVIMLDFWGDW